MNCSRDLTRLLRGALRAAAGLAALVCDALRLPVRGAAGLALAAGGARGLVSSSTMAGQLSGDWAGFSASLARAAGVSGVSGSAACAARRPPVG